MGMKIRMTEIGSMNMQAMNRIRFVIIRKKMGEGMCLTTA